ncbi:MAG: hypothetical protein ACFCVH_21860 [Alphaproteobacteria bacterium]
MLLDIAEGIGGAAKILPEASRSAVGAVALKRASVEIDFELSTAAVRKDGSAGLGAKTFLFGFGTSSTTTEALARNHGRIELEIVAFVEPEPQPADTKASGGKLEPPRPGGESPSPVLDMEQIRIAMAAMRAEIARLSQSEAERAKLEQELDRAADLIAAGDLDGAGAILKQIQQQLKALSGQSVTDNRGSEP